MPNLENVNKELFLKQTLEDTQKILDFNRSGYKERGKELREKFLYHSKSFANLFETTQDTCRMLEESSNSHVLSIITIMAHLENLGLITINK